MFRRDFDFPGLDLIFTKAPLNFRAVTQGPKVAQAMDQAISHLSLKPRAIYSCNQIHSDIILEARDLDQGEAFHYGRIFRDGDGIITNLSQVALVTKVADCVPLLLYDPVNQVQASLHSGWRGTLAKIGPKALDLMVKDYSCKRENMYAFIGPAISWEAFEVMEDVSSQWYKTFSFAHEVVKEKDEDHQCIDLKETNRRLLIESGLKGDQIILAPETTYESKDLHSYRRDQPDFGINAMISMLIPKNGF